MFTLTYIKGKQSQYRQELNLPWKHWQIVQTVQRMLKEKLNVGFHRNIPLPACTNPEI